MKEPMYPVVIIEQTPERKIGMALLYFFALIGMIDVLTNGAMWVGYACNRARSFCEGQGDSWYYII